MRSRLISMSLSLLLPGGAALAEFNCELKFEEIRREVEKGRGSALQEKIRGGWCSPQGLRPAREFHQHCQRWIDANHDRFKLVCSPDPARP